MAEDAYFVLLQQQCWILFLEQHISIFFSPNFTQKYNILHKSVQLG